MDSMTDTNELAINSDTGIQAGFGYPACSEMPNNPQVSAPKVNPDLEKKTTSNSWDDIGSKSQKRKFYDYMILNPIILKTIEQVAGKSFILPPNAEDGEFPELSESEAHEVLCQLKHRIPRQPDCPNKPRFANVSVEYCAGVIDSEAHVSTVMYQYTHRRHPGFRLLTCITQNHHEMLQAVHCKLGANGAIYSLPRRIGQNRQCYDLRYNGIHAMAAIAKVYPYLIRKKSLALMLVKMYADGRLWEHVGTRGIHPVIADRRIKLHAKIKRMD